MYEFLKARPTLAYTCFWIWLALVSTRTLFLFNEIAGWAGLIINNVFGLPILIEDPPAPWLATTAMYVAGTLLWWRVTKVMVLHGAPLSLGMEVIPRRQDEGKTGRLATLVHIGDFDVHGKNYGGKFYYGAVFRAHPNSDKLMRSRLEMLVLFIPMLGWTLSVHESRLFIRKHDHQTRGKIYRLISDRYLQND